MTRRRCAKCSHAHGHSIAAVIIEPLPANYGLLPQRPEFLQELVQLARTHGALVIFDEVISGFRVALGGHGGTTRRRSRTSSPTAR